MLPNLAHFGMTIRLDKTVFIEKFTSFSPTEIGPFRLCDGLSRWIESHNSAASTEAWMLLSTELSYDAPINCVQFNYRTELLSTRAWYHVAGDIRERVIVELIRAHKMSAARSSLLWRPLHDKCACVVRRPWVCLPIETRCWVFV